MAGAAERGPAAAARARTGGGVARRLALFITCFNDTLCPQTGRAVVRLLERLGHTVEFHRARVCCGQMHFNTGYRPEALSMVRRFAEVFAGYAYVVSRPVPAPT
ncbi:heterodisulfide reductase-related iron-sulfur binding cluster [Streptomyces tubercidicus]|uniref:heterodisulfide reductase-related iron-sulfur binding cluster n=1 Tax=Streptomyces tubercidicus TaxID=47759 RepID=UPI00399B6136